jgi:hypothetical protein
MDYEASEGKGQTMLRTMRRFLKCRSKSRPTCFRRVPLRLKEWEQRVLPAQRSFATGRMFVHLPFSRLTQPSPCIKDTNIKEPLARSASGGLGGKKL